MVPSQPDQLKPTPWASMAKDAASNARNPDGSIKKDFNRGAFAANCHNAILAEQELELSVLELFLDCEAARASHAIEVGNEVGNIDLSYFKQLYDAARPDFPNQDPRERGRKYCIFKASELRTRKPTDAHARGAKVRAAAWEKYADIYLANAQPAPTAVSSQG